MKKKVLTSITGILLAAALVGGATFAEFTSTGTSSGNIFTAGTLTMTMNGLTGEAGQTWKTPANWAPGDTVTNSIKFSNTGTIDGKHIYLGFKNVTGTVMLDNVYVKEIKETFNGTAVTTDPATIESQVVSGTKDGKLSLREFTDFLKGSYGYYTWDDKTMDNVIIAAGNKQDYELSFTFEFDKNAGDDCQGQSAGFDLMAKATQNSPTEGLVELHQ